MVETQTVPESDAGRGDSKLNDFSLAVATANGTGSQTANLTLLRAFFKMGIPVHGKNIFPSNIQGLPTWYHIRVSRDGYVARSEPELLVAFNRATIREDVATLPDGAAVLANADLKYEFERDDLLSYRLPVKELLEGTEAKGKLKDYLANMTYVGALAQLLGVPLSVIEEALGFHFGRRQKLVASNMAIVEASFGYSEREFTKRDPYRVAPMSATEGLIMMTGNEAAALGSVFGGVSVAAWYPITPSTSLIDALRGYLAELRTEEDGSASFNVVQAEDELAAIGMVVGAGWAGARAMTATSGPGISLMAEFAGLGYFAEVPAVVWDIQRVGPSTGLPTRTSQGDVAFVYNLGHGDTRNVILFPSSIEECFEFGVKSFDFAERLQTPVFVLSDLDLGMNNWMGRPFEYPAEPMDRGKVLSAAEIDERGGFSRYLDNDGDGVPYRTLPGNSDPRSAYLARGTGHDEHAVYSERPEDWRHNGERLARKFDSARRLLPEPILDEPEGSTLAIVAFGSTRYAIEEARDRLAVAGLTSAFLRLRALPIGEKVREFVGRHDRIAVVEMNRDGQLCAILRGELPEFATRFESIAYLDGMPLTAEWVSARLDELAAGDRKGEQSG
ncbi:MAG: 2-oxoacid:acceptor oxidoreductase subunit alpha [Trueperaceae bacterium]